MWVHRKFHGGGVGGNWEAGRLSGGDIPSLGALGDRRGTGEGK